MRLESHDAPLHVAAVRLAVVDIAAMTKFYVEGLGLAVIEQGRESVRLGVDDVTLLTLEACPEAVREDPASAGLFHTAFLLPSRAELGAWLSGAAARGLRFTGMSDHSVSEAIYLDDPEGNGIEVYADRPRAAWRRSGGGVEMSTAALGVDDLLAAGRKLGRPVDAFPSGSRIGHIHLRVGDLAAAEAFYGRGLGLDLMHSRPQARFFASGGYHHHIAANTWGSARAGRRSAGTTGLLSFELGFAEGTTLETVAPRLRAGGFDADAINGRLVTHDPWGIEIVMRSAAA